MKIAVVGLGYVGLPLALELAKENLVHGFDINQKRVNELLSGIDKTNEVEAACLLNSKITFCSDEKNLSNMDVFIVTVPTPVDAANQPDLTALVKASEMVGSVMKRGALVIYESTVYPGATEEVCLPVLEKFSGFKLNIDFRLGYSPERINPGDKNNTIRTIKKVISGSDALALKLVDEVYHSIIDAGLHLAPSIKVAEAAKVIENTQRDVNIALINEFAQIFNLIGISTYDVLEAAATKWNFAKYTPGLVGGHCIGVDPYYLAHKAKTLGFNPEIISGARRVSNNMGRFIADLVIKDLMKNKVDLKSSRVLVLGYTFKENCPDIRNTRVIDVVERLQEFNLDVDIYDPMVAISETSWDPFNGECNKLYSSIILAVPHDFFKKIGAERIKSKLMDRGLVYDIKNMFPDEHFITL